MDWVDLLIDNLSPDLAYTPCLEDVQMFFEVGDKVRFNIGDSDTMTGTVEKLNPKRAGVRCGANRWAVPYIGLDHLCESTASDRRPRAARLREVAMQARELMDRHGLEEWTLRFNVAQGKLGECRSGQKRILLSRLHAVSGSREQVTDTILHEIAHALAGPEAGHGPTWKAIARRIGATPKARMPESDERRRHREGAKEKFRNGDNVSFINRNERRTGMIVRMNPKRAKVECTDGVWLVPYARLNAIDHCDGDSGKPIGRVGGRLSGWGAGQCPHTDESVWPETANHVSNCRRGDADFVQSWLLYDDLKGKSRIRICPGSGRWCTIETMSQTPSG